jgi:uncharacterized protein YceK
MKTLIVLSVMFLLSGCASMRSFYGDGFRDYDSGMKFNYHEKRWEFAPSPAELKFNYLESQWQYTK